ncbi:MAG: hypothetical protein K1X89_20155 [Myxococcaceae bacterium]|nr:hypothetical protein [Myxococcaceae bacterium]
MPGLLVASLAVNIGVLLPVVAGLLLDAAWAKEAFGPRAPGRQILLAIYLSILTLSSVLFVWRDAKVAAGLLLAQCLYKVLTPLTVGTLRHPVVLSNLAIAALHAVTLSTLLAA